MTDVSAVYARLLSLAESPEVRAIDPGLHGWLSRNADVVRKIIGAKLGTKSAQSGPPMPVGLYEPERWPELRAQVVEALQALLNSRVVTIEGYNAEDTHPQGDYVVLRQTRGPYYTGLGFVQLLQLPAVKSAARRLTELFEGARPGTASMHTIDRVYKQSQGRTVAWELLSHLRDRPAPRTHDQHGRALDEPREAAASAPTGISASGETAVAKPARASKAPPDPATMTAGQINKELDALDKRGSEITRQFIEAGRGHERPSDWRDKSDPLSMAQKANADRYQALRIEMEMRYGPRVPSRLPSRGYGPRVQAPRTPPATPAPATGPWQAKQRTDAPPQGLDDLGPLTAADAKRLFTLTRDDELVAVQRGWDAARRWEVATAPPDLRAFPHLERLYTRAYFAAANAVADAHARAVQAREAAVLRAQREAERRVEDAKLERLRTAPTRGPTRSRAAPELPSGRQDALAAWTVAKTPAGPLDAARWLAFRKALLSAATAKAEAAKAILAPALTALTDSGVADAGTVGAPLTNTEKGLEIAMLQWLNEATFLMPEYQDAQGEYAGDPWADDIEEAVATAKFRLEHPRAKAAQKPPFPPDWAFRFAQAEITAEAATRDWENAPTMPAIRAWAKWATTAPEAQLAVRDWTAWLVQDVNRRAGALRALGRAPSQDLRTILSEYGVLPPADLPMFPNRNPR